nr:zinc finger, CCHC-type, retrotransposon Gag domain protein [Tanacetum cinerariifolium]
MFDELLNPPPSVDNQATEVIGPIAEVIPQVDDDSIGSPSSTTVDQDAPSPSKSLTPTEIQSSVIHQDVGNDNLDIEVAHMGNDSLLSVPILEVTSEQSSSTTSPQSNVQPNHPMTHHNSKWTKDHPLNYIIGLLSRPVSTRLQLHEQALFCYYDAFLTSVEPKTYKEALTQACWIEAMQEELNEFERLEIWELVPRPDKVMFSLITYIPDLLKTLCLLNYALMKRHDYDITSSLRRGALQLWYQSQTLLPQIRAEIREEFRTSSGLSDAGGNPPPVTIHTWLERFNKQKPHAFEKATAPNALQTLLPRIREEIREEFRTGSGSSNAGGNPPPVTIHTWLERFNKQKPHSFEKATVPVDAENWISHMENIFDVMGYEDDFKTRLVVYKFEGNALAWWKAYKQAKGGDAWLVTVTWADFKKLFFLQFFPRAEQERLKREYHSIRQISTETSTEFMQRFLRLAGFLRTAAGTEEEQSTNFQWGLRRSTLNHLMCISD